MQLNDDSQPPRATVKPPAIEQVVVKGFKSRGPEARWTSNDS